MFRLPVRELTGKRLISLKFQTHYTKTPRLIYLWGFWLRSNSEILPLKMGRSIYPAGSQSTTWGTLNHELLLVSQNLTIIYFFVDRGPVLWYSAAMSIRMLYRSVMPRANTIDLYTHNDDIDRATCVAWKYYTPTKISLYLKKSV